MAQYQDGTVDLVSGSQVVQLVDGVAGGNIAPGQWFVARGVPGEVALFTVTAVNSGNNTFSLNVPWPYPSDSGRPYAIHRDFSPSGFPEIDQTDVQLPSIWNEWIAVLEGVLSGSISITTSGTEWFTGSGTPSNSLGNDGDFYLNTTSADLYTKQGGSWGTPIMNLKGPEGDPGTGGGGTPGPAGPGVPVGGATGQVLQKLSGVDYDTGWRAKVDDLASWALYGRLAATPGPPAAIGMNDLAPKVPVPGDYLAGFAATGEPKRFDVGNMPSSTGGAGEPVSGGNLVPNAIVIDSREIPYNPYTQNGPVTLGLDLVNSNYNQGEAVFYFTSDGSGITWQNLVWGPDPSRSLATNFTVGTTLQMVIVLDEPNGRGLVYYSSNTDNTKLPLAGGTMTGTIQLSSGAAIRGIDTAYAQLVHVELKSLVTTFFDMGTVAGGALTIDYSRGNYQRIILSGNITSVNVTNRPAIGSAAMLTLQIHQDSAAARTINWGSNFLFPGSAPFAITTPGQINLLEFVSWDGVSWLGKVNLANYAVAPYAPVGVVFDGNDYMTWLSGITGAVNTTDFTFAFWLKLRTDIPASDQIIFSVDQTANPGYPSLLIGRRANNSLYIFGQNGGTTNLSYNTSILTVGNIYVVLGSFGGTQHQLYINDAPDGTSVTHNNVARTLVNQPATIGTFAGSPGAYGNFNGELSDFLFDQRLVDLTVTANRRKFGDATNHLVFKGANGELPFNTRPLVYHSGAASTWSVNLGTGGPCVLTGALGTSVPAPIGA